MQAAGFPFALDHSTFDTKVSSLQTRQKLKKATHFLHAGQIPGLCAYETMTT